MKFDKNYILYALFLISICCLTYHNFRLNKLAKKSVVKIEEIKSDSSQIAIIHYEEKIKDLSNVNKELYDSIKIFKDKIDYLVQFRYNKKYKTGKVKTDSIKNKINKDTIINTYEFSEKNDTVSYKLMIGSQVKPEWYSLDFNVSDKFTIVNKDYGNFNKLDINSNSSGIINDVTVLKKKEKNRIIDNFSIGPSLSLGYNFGSKEPEIILGISITYDIKKLFKKK